MHGYCVGNQNMSNNTPAQICIRIVYCLFNYSLSTMAFFNIQQLVGGISGRQTYEEQFSFSVPMKHFLMQLWQHVLDKFIVFF